MNQFPKKWSISLRGAPPLLLLSSKLIHFLEGARSTGCHVIFMHLTWTLPLPTSDRKYGKIIYYGDKHMVIFLKYLSIWNTLNTLPQNILLQTTFYFFHTCKIQITKYTKVIKYVFKIHLIEILPMSVNIHLLFAIHPLGYYGIKLIKSSRLDGFFLFVFMLLFSWLLYEIFIDNYA